MNRARDIGRAPAATPGSPAYRPHAGRRREEIGGQYGAGRRRVFWGQEGGYYPPFSITGERRRNLSGAGISQNEIPIIPLLATGLFFGGLALLLARGARR